MSTRNSEHKSYYISPTAVTIVENVDDDHRRLIISVNEGSVIKVWSEAVTAGENKTFFRTDDRGEFRQWTLRGRRPYLDQSNAAQPHLYLYIRIASNSDVAEFVFSPDGPDRKPFTGIKASSDDDSSNVYYYYIHVGDMVKRESSQLFDLTWDSGMLDTTQYWATHGAVGELFELVESGEYIAPKKPFSNLSIHGLLTLASRKIRQVLIHDEKESEEKNEDGTPVADEQIVSAGFLNTTWLTKLRGLFVNKDTAGTESMKGSLHIGKSLQVDSSVTAASATISGEMSSETASVKGKLSAGSAEIKNGVKASSASITNGLSAGSAEVKGTTSSGKFELTGSEDGDFGHGASMWKDQAGNGHIDGDFMTIRRAAYFRELTISEVKHIGGEMILSQAACTIGDVVEVLTGEDPETGEAYIPVYRCYFEKQSNGKQSYNEWRPGDQAYCSAWANAQPGTQTDVRTQYYWRLVVEVGEGEGAYSGYWYVDLSKDDCAAGSGTPAANDNIALLGYRYEDTTGRSTAQVYSTVGNNAPSRIYYQDIHGYSLEGCRVETMEWNQSDRFAHWRVGTESGGYVDFSKDGLRIKANSVIMSGTGKDLAEIYDENIDIHMLEREDGHPTPSVDNDGEYTESGGFTFDWANPTDHINDICITAEGFCYRFEDHPDYGYVWRMVTDKYLVDAITRVNDVNTIVSKITVDGMIIPSEKITLREFQNRILHEETERRQKVTYILGSGINVRHDDDNSYLSDLLLASKSYLDAYTPLLSALTSIIRSTEAVIPVPANLNSLIVSYNNAYRKLQDLYAELNTFYFRQTDESTALGNRFFGKDKEGDYYVKEGGLVTTAGYAELFAQEVSDKGIATKAEISSAVTDGIANASISADQINLQGYTNINGAFRISSNGSFYAENGVFGGLTYDRYNVICNSNKNQYGYGSSGSFVLDFKKCGSNFMIYGHVSQGSGDTSGSADEPSFGSVFIALPSVGLPRYGVDEWRRAVNENIARQYVGKRINIRLHYENTVSVNGILDLDDDRKVVQKIIEAQRDIYQLTLVCEERQVTFRYAEQLEYVTCNVIGWRVEHEGNVSNETSRSVTNAQWRFWEDNDVDRIDMYPGEDNPILYYYFLPSYHVEPDMITDCWYNQSNVISVEDKSILYSELEKIESAYIVVVRKFEKSANQKAFLEYKAAYEDLERNLRKEPWFIHGLYNTPLPLFPRNYTDMNGAIHEGEFNYMTDEAKFIGADDVAINSKFEDYARGIVPEASANTIRISWIKYYRAYESLTSLTSNPLKQ